MHFKGFGAPQSPLPVWSRNLARTVVAAVIVATIVVVLDWPLDPSAWAIVAVCVVANETTGASVVAGLNRIQGSIVGCLVGGVVVTLLLPVIPLPICVGISIAACIVICRLLRIGAGVKLGSALAGFFVFVPGDQEWEMVGWRLLATVTGIVIALLVVAVMWPERAAHKARIELAEAVGVCQEVLQLAVARWKGDIRPASTPAAASLKAGVSKVRALIGDLRHEPTGRHPSPNQMEAIIDGIDLALMSANRLDQRTLEVTYSPVIGSFVDEELGSLVGRVEHLALTLQLSILRGDEGKPIGTDLEIALDELGSFRHDVDQALDGLREQGVTPKVASDQLVSFFSALAALTDLADGLSQAASQIVAFNKSLGNVGVHSG